MIDNEFKSIKLLVTFETSDNLRTEAVKGVEGEECSKDDDLDG